MLHAILATSVPQLPPGDYYMQIYGKEIATFGVQDHLTWEANPNWTVPESKIDGTMRVTTRIRSDVWKADVFTSNGQVELWVKVRPLPTLP